jgi:hypothetical protein
LLKYEAVTMEMTTAMRRWRMLKATEMRRNIIVEAVAVRDLMPLVAILERKDQERGKVELMEVERRSPLHSPL